MSAVSPPPQRGHAGSVVPSRPLTVTVDQVAGMLNFELADDPVYDSGELQWFDDDVHGTGMLAFLCRRGDRRVDYYAQPGLRLDRGGYQLAGGTGSWTETDFDVARLDIADDGVDAHVRFVDVDGQPVEIAVNDRDGEPRRRGGLLAPVGAAIDEPTSLLLVWMPAFDLVRDVGTPPVLRFGGRDAAIGRLPGARFHRRHLIKYAAPVIAVQVNPADGIPVPLDVGQPDVIVAEQAGHRARLILDPPMPNLIDLPPEASATGRWLVEVDGAQLCAGTWTATRGGARVDLALAVTQRWEPGPLPWLMRLVTTVVPVFRRWPTTYRWHAVVELHPAPEMTARWERTTGDRARSYRRATGTFTERRRP